MYFFNRITIALILLAILKSTLGLNRRIDFNALECTHSPHFISNITTSIVNSHANLDLNVVKALTMGYRAYVDMQIRLSRRAKYQSLFAYEFDICQALQTIFKGNLMNKWYKQVLQNSNFMPNCPVAEGHYYLREMSFNAASIPIYLHPGDYRIVGRSFFGKHKSKSEQFVCECTADVKIE